MAQNNKYPDINYETVFKIYSIGLEIKKNPKYVAESPYSEPIKKSLNLIFPPVSINTGESSSKADLPTMTNLDLKTEIINLYWQTKELLKSNEIDDKDKASIQRTATTQLEKLLTLAERATNLNQMREFESKVLKILKKVLPEQREMFLRELAESESREELGTEPGAGLGTTKVIEEGKYRL
jgi:hypothetical protein